MSDIEVLPEDLVAAAEPLRRAAEALREVADGRRALIGLVEASPSPRVVAAFREFLSSWELTVWSAGGDAAVFAEQLDLSAAFYARHDAAIAQGIQPAPAARPQVRSEYVARVALPHPVAQAAPAPAP